METDAAFTGAQALAAVGNDADLLHRIAQVFLEHQQLARVGLAAAVQSADLGRTREIAHDLKGMASTVGARQLAERAARLELAARAQTGAELASELVPTLAALDQVTDVMAALARSAP